MTPLFVELVKSGLEMWQAEAVTLRDSEIGRINDQRGHLLEVLQFGLKTPQVQRDSAKLVAMFFPLAERGGYLSEWRDMLREAAACVSDTDRLHVELLRQLGYAETMCGAHDVAFKALSTSLRIAEQHAWVVDQGAAMYCLALVAYQQDDAPEARRWAETAYQLLSDVSAETPQRPKAVALLNLGFIVQQEGDREQAIRWFAAAAEQFKHLGDLTYQGRALANRARALRLLGRLDEALATIEEAEACFKQTATETDKAQVRIMRGAILFDRGDLSGADAAYKSAETDTLRQQERHNLLAEIYLNRAEVCLKLNTYQDARGFLTAALDESTLAGLIVYQILAYDMLVEAELGLDKQSAACEWLDKAIEQAHGSDKVPAQKVATLTARREALCD